MVLEATVICIDNSEWTRNGDFSPTRLDAHMEAVNLMASCKLQSNPESSVAVMTMAGKAPEVLITLTPEYSRICTALVNVRPQGNIHLLSSLQVAQLALKHRFNKNQRQRIIALVSSPLEVSEQDLSKLGKKLKKNNVALDVVCFGDDLANKRCLEMFISSVNTSEDTCHLIVLPIGTPSIVESLVGSPVLANEPSAAMMAAAGMYGVDSAMDPELALAIRMSLEDSHPSPRGNVSMSERAEMDIVEGGSTTDTPSNLMGGGVPSSAPGEEFVQDLMEEDEQAMLERAIAMSLEHEFQRQPYPGSSAMITEETPDAEGLMHVEDAQGTDTQTEETTMPPSKTNDPSNNKDTQKDSFPKQSSSNPQE